MSQPVFGIRGILVLIQMKIPDPWIHTCDATDREADADPALFVFDLQDTNNKKISF
jgi:hypothetical protein